MNKTELGHQLDQLSEMRSILRKFADEFFKNGSHPEFMMATLLANKIRTLRLEMSKKHFGMKGDIT